ncbi:MAG: glucosaminidase domain-containing protein, partial [Turicibacter sp.]|nr:glucosaminidase domain-containing protein [Turicibacter sp.]
MSYTSLGGFGFSGLTTFLGPLVSGKVEVDGEEMSSVEYIAKQSESARANPGYFDPVALTVNAKDYQKLADTMRNIPKGRDVLPLPYYDNVQYSHRSAITDITSYTRIGDTVLMIPPTFIGVFNDGQLQEVSNIRQNGTTKINQGFNQRTVVMTLFFCGANQINGYKVESPHGSKSFYMDGVRSLLAQFRSTPFLPIQNILLNATYGIYTVSLNNIEVQTVEGFPDCLEVTLTLTEFNSSIYTEIPDAFFDSLIDWDLFRYGYQRHLNDSSFPRYMPPIKTNSGDYHFKISLIDEEIFNDSTSDALDDMKINQMFKTILTHDSDLILTHITFGLSNTIVQTTMASHSAPALQYMGGTDARVQVFFETRNQHAVSVVEQIIERFRSLSRQFKDYNHFGFLRFENEYVQLTGTEFFVIDQVESTTVPEFPGLFKISMSLIGFDIRQESYENLKGMRPFNRKGTKSDAITQDAQGVMNRIKQDNYIERQMMEKFELYPDLNLPTYSEINTAITKINAYRQRKGLSKLPYTSYPEQRSVLPGKNLDGTYSKFLDPDFYMMYPLSFEDFDDKYINGLINHESSTDTGHTIPDLDYGERYVQDKRSSYLVEEGYINLSSQLGNSVLTESGGLKNHYNDIYGNIQTGGGTTLNANADTYVKLLKEQVGKKYVWGATGQYYGGVQGWDCSGFVCWGLWQLGLWKNSQGQGMRFVTADFNGGEKKGYWRYISFLELKPGDLCLVKGHIGVYIGTDENGVPRTVEAMNPSKGICIGWVKDSKTWYYDRFARITAFETKTSTTSPTVNNYTNYYHSSLEKELGFEDDESYLEWLNGSNSTSGSKTNIRMDMKFDSRVTATVLDGYFKKGLVGYGKMFVKHCKTYNVDPALVAAVCIFESDWGTSDLFVYYNNPGGISGKGAPNGFQVYGSKEDGVEALASLLGRKYVPLKTIAAMGKIYCPPDDPRDTAGTNSLWAVNVKKIFVAIKAKAYNQSSEVIETAYANGGGQYTDTNPSLPAAGDSYSDTNGSGYTKTPVDVPFGYEEIECTDSTFKQDDAGSKVNDQTASCTNINR